MSLRAKRGNLIFRMNTISEVIYEVHQDIKLAIEREKQIKAGPRRKKIELVTTTNQDWSDLYGELRY